MIKLGITGYPLLYTRSPALHRSFLRQARRAGRYDVLPFNPKLGHKAFFLFLDSLASNGYSGINITVPLKEWAYAYARDVVPGLHGKGAASVKAANTLVFTRRGALAANTDAYGLWTDLEKKFGKKIPAAFDVVIIGTGGSARGAIAGILSRQGFSKNVAAVEVWGRDRKKAAQLQRLLKSRQPSLERPCLVLWCLPPVSAREAKLIFKKALPECDRRACFLYDLNYGEHARATTSLVPRLRRSTGVGMLQSQARASFNLWVR